MERMFASDRLASEIEVLEGFKDRPYKCLAGHMTIGFGHEIKPNEQWVLPMDKDFARTLLRSDIDDFATQLWNHINRQPTQNQFDAMLSLAYNAGASVLYGSHLLTFFEAGYIGMAADEFLKFDKYHDPDSGLLLESTGLLNRRKRERDIFLGRAW